MEYISYGYARCSTNETRQDIDRQVRELIKLGCDPKLIYTEYESGSKKDRAAFLRLQNDIPEGARLVATEVSRLSRSTIHLCEIVEFVHAKRLRLEFGGMIVDCTSGELNPFSEAVVKILGVVAELERNMIRERVVSGLENARAKGALLGRPSLTAEDIPASFLRYLRQYENKQINLAELSRLSEISRPTAYKYIKILNGESIVPK